MKKYIWSFVLSLLVFFVVAGTFSHVSASTSRLYLNNELLKTDVNPIVVNNVTLVPVAFINKGLGQDIAWDGVARQVTVTAPNLVIQLTIGSTTAKINNVAIDLPVAATLVQGRTMVPLRFVSENLGLKVNYIKETKDIYIVSPDFSPTPSPVPTPTPSPVPTPTPSPVPTPTPSPVPTPTPSPVPTPTPAPSGNTSSSNLAKAVITNITLDEKQSIQVTYQGELSQPKVLELTEPRRVIVDIPNTDFNQNIYSQFINGQTEHRIDNNPQMKAYRYALFSNAPLTSRIVIELEDNSIYQVLHEKGKLSIVFGDSVDASKPTVPNLLVYIEDILSDDPNRIYNIVLDPGHGLKDPGAINKTNGLFEKTFNLSFGLKLEKELSKYKRIKVHMTRDDDSFLELDERIAFAESLPGLNVRADMFISIHANSFTNATVNGTETYYFHNNSKTLAEKVHPVLLNSLGLNDRKVRTAGFKVIKNAVMPAILLEVGFMSNSKDVEYLFNEEKQAKLAKDFAAAIAEYLNVK